MFNQEKDITSDILNYLIHGQHEGSTYDGNLPSYNPSDKTWSSEWSNVKYRFIKKYEDVNAISSNVIPVLVVTSPIQYHSHGKVLFKGQWKDLRSILTNQAVNQGQFRIINYYVVPQVLGFFKASLGSVKYEVKIDFNADEDKFGFFSKEISQIVANHYYKENCNEYFKLFTNDMDLYVVPQSIQPSPPSKSILCRTTHLYDLKYCCSIVN